MTLPRGRWNCRFLVLAGAVLAMACLREAIAGDDVLSIVPQDALGVAVVHRFGELNDKVNKITQKLGVPAPDPLQLGKLTLGIEAGLDEKGHIAIAAMPTDDENRPEPVLFVATTDYNALLKPFSPTKDGDNTVVEITFQGRTRPHYAAKKGNFAVLVRKRDGGDAAMLKRVLDSDKSLADGLGTTKDWVTANDMAVVVGPAGVKLGCDKVLAAMQQAKDQLGLLGDAQQQELLKSMIGAYESLFQIGQKEVTHFAFGIRLETDGHLHIASNTLFKTGGTCAKLLADVKPAEGGPLANLPAGPFVVAGGGPMPAQMMDEMMGWWMNVIKNMPGTEKIDKDKFQKFVEGAAKITKRVKSGSGVMGIGKPGTGIYGGMSGLIRVDDTKAYLAEAAKMAEEMKSLFKDADNPFIPQMDVKQTEIDGLPTMEATIDIASISGKQSVPGLENLYGKLFGEGGKISVYYTAVDATTLAVGYVSKDNVSRLIKQIKSSDKGLAADPGVAKTAALLPKDAQWAGYFSPKGAFEMGMMIAKAIAPDEIPPIPDFPATPPVALAAKATGGSFETDLVIPAETWEAAVGYAMKFQER